MDKPPKSIQRKAIVLRSRIDVITWDDAIGRILDLGTRRHSSYVCACNVHSVVAAWQNPEFQSVINDADMAVPDGAPVAWAIRRLEYSGQQRIDGPDLMWRLCEQSARRGLPVFLYGSTERTLKSLSTKLRNDFPGIQIVDTYSPPFRALSEDEDRSITARINSSKAAIVFVGLGCPKQEMWMASHRGRVNAVMLGVGAAFDYHAGSLKRAPLWMQHCGLEWLHRLYMEPRRLWKRYLITNVVYVLAISFQILRRNLEGFYARRRSNSV